MARSGSASGSGPSGAALVAAALILSAGLLLSVFAAAWLSPHNRCVRATAEASPRAGALYVETECLKAAGGG